MLKQIAEEDIKDLKAGVIIKDVFSRAIKVYGHSANFVHIEDEKDHWQKFYFVILQKRVDEDGYVLFDIMFFKNGKSYIMRGVELCSGPYDTLSVFSVL
jgi:hypothetical protein